MSERARSLVFATAIVTMAVALLALIATNPSDVDRVESIGQQIKCPVCQGESIADSPAQMARDMMDLVAERVADGLDDEAVINELLSSFSGAVLLDPPVAGSTLALWLAPIGALVVGFAVIVWWRRHADAEREPTPTGRGVTPRVVIPLAVLIVALGVAAILTSVLVEDGQGAASGVADLAGDDLEEVSNETLEAVIAANVDHPAIDGMRLALAERYFEVGDYQSAFPHYLEVASSPNASADQAVAALVSLGWMVWDGNGEAERAIELFDEALRIDGASYTAKYLKGEVVWCGLGDADAAASLFEEALADPGVSEASRIRIESSLAAVNAGEECA
ncbi:MAG: cytochrome c-type biogenesis protein CcmH [Acidimicrobiia bacterium]|jgi:cytochrome c-type biogenesis protein CcmH